MKKIDTKKYFKFVVVVNAVLFALHIWSWLEPWVFDALGIENTALFIFGFLYVPLGIVVFNLASFIYCLIQKPKDKYVKWGLRVNLFFVLLIISIFIVVSQMTWLGITPVV